MSTTLTKTNPTCSNIELIDANTCYGDALPIINSNIANLTATLISLKNTINSWESIINNFPLNSIKTLTTMFNIKLINDTFNSPYALLQSLSSQWNNQQFSVYYPTITSVDYWYNKGNGLYSTSTDMVTSILTPWLSGSFPANNFVNNQIINVFVNLSFTNVFTFYYHGNLTEYCLPQYHTAATLTCNGCGDANYRFGACNHDAGGRHWCDNAYSYCTQETTNQSNVYSCKGVVGKTYIWNTNDLLKNNLQWSANGNIITVNNPYDNLVGVGQQVKISNAINSHNLSEPNLNGIHKITSIDIIANNFKFTVNNAPTDIGGVTQSTLTLDTLPSYYVPVRSYNLGDLHIAYTKHGNDTFTTRIVSYNFININSNWVLQS